MGVPGVRRGIYWPEIPDRVDTPIGGDKRLGNNAAALLDHLGGHVEDAHERDRAGGDPAGRVDHVPFGPEMAERETGPAAGLVDERLVLDGLKDGFEGILDAKRRNIRAGVSTTRPASSLRRYRRRRTVSALEDSLADVVTARRMSLHY